MAKVSFTTKGYIEVWWQSPAGLVFLSRHRQETEAVEALTAHAATQIGDQDYELRFPNKTVKAYGILAAQGSPPVTPTGLFLQSVTATVVVISWADAGDATQWTVYRGGVALGTISAVQYTDTAVVPSTAYSYQVQASNAAGASALSAAFPVTTPANSVPVWSLSNQTALLNSGFSLNLADYCDDPDGHSLTFTLVSGTVPGLSLVGTTYSGTPSAVAVYPLTFRANDGYGTTNVSINLTVNDPDVTAPTVPVVGQATASGSTVTVPWTASTDASGVQNYDVYRSSDGTNYSFRSLQTISPYTDSGVANGTWYYKVRARDNSTNHNVSALSSATSVVVSVAPPAPDVPINFVATAVSSSQINLSWAAGPNGATPTDYDLDFATAGASGPWSSIPIGLVTSYSHTGRSASTPYWYRVRANNGVTPSASYAAANATTQAAGTGYAWPTQGAVSYTPIVRNLRGPGVNTPAGSGRTINVIHAPGQVVTASTVRKVTSLLDNGSAGTLRSQLNAHNSGTGPSVVVFEVAGAIDISPGAYLRVNRGNLTIAGQTAPAPGITLVRHALAVDRAVTDLLVQHLTLRLGEGSAIGLADAATVGGTSGSTILNNIVFDHCTIQWGADEVIELINSQNLTFSNSLIAECLQFNHQYVTMMKYNQDNILMYGCLSMNGSDRHPLTTSWKFAHVNNLIYNYGFSGLRFQTHWDDNVNAHTTQNSVVGNVFKRGPSGSQAAIRMENWHNTTNDGVVGSKYWISDNIGHVSGGTTVVAASNDPTSQWQMVANVFGVTNASLQPSPYTLANAPYWPTGLVAKSNTVTSGREDVADTVLWNVGARPKERRGADGTLLGTPAGGAGFYDSTTRRLIQQANTAVGAAAGTQGSWPTTVAGAYPGGGGGWPTYTSGSRPFTPVSNPNTIGASGYTRLEEQIHALEDQVL